MTSRATTTTTSTKESDVYDRQIRLWGAEAQVGTQVGNPDLPFYPNPSGISCHRSQFSHYLFIDIYVCMYVCMYVW